MSDTTEDMVVFLMPDGTRVSNDPRFDLAEAREEMLASKPNSGDVGILRSEQEAQTQAMRLANLQSAQPGVGENAAPEDPQELIPTQGSGLQVQKDDVKEARETGAEPATAEVEDSNEKVLQVRKEQEEAREQALEAEAKLGDDGAGDPEQDYSEWSGKQLKAEALKRNAEREEGDQIDLSGVTRKKQLVELLRQDDQRGTA